MSKKARSWLWFLVPTLVVAALVIAISIPGLKAAQQEIGADSLTIPIVAMLILAAFTWKHQTQSLFIELFGRTWIINAAVIFLLFFISKIIIVSHLLKIFITITYSYPRELVSKKCEAPALETVPLVKISCLLSFSRRSR